MAILIVLIPLGLVLLGIAIAAFVWAVDHDQFDNLEVEGERILFDEPERALQDESDGLEAGGARPPSPGPDSGAEA